MNYKIVEEKTDYRKSTSDILTVIKVFGVGGGGCNAIKYMVESGLKNVEFYAVNTDLQALDALNDDSDLDGSEKIRKIQIGGKISCGLGAGSIPDVGKTAAEESEEELKKAISGAHMIFITAGMGGGTGTGAAPVIARIAKELGALTVAVVTKPFGFEGMRKMKIAEEGIKKLRDEVDCIIAIPNEALFEIYDTKMNMIECFYKANIVLLQGVQGISDVITYNGIVNVDFSDVKTVMKVKGKVLMGVGIAKGPDRAIKSASLAMNNPLLLGASIEGAKALLIGITANNSLTMAEFGEIVNMVQMNVDPEALIVFGRVDDSDMEDEVKVTIVAAGLEEKEEINSPEKRKLPTPVNTSNDEKNQKYNSFGSFDESDEALLIPACQRKQTP